MVLCITYALVNYTDTAMLTTADLALRYHNTDSRQLFRGDSALGLLAAKWSSNT
mgnify:FL=1